MPEDKYLKDLELPNIEERFLRRLLNTPSKHHLLEIILPGIFSQTINRLIIFIMKQMYAKRIPLTLNNILQYYIQSKEVRSFRYKYKIPMYSQDDLTSHLDVKEPVIPDDLFDSSYLTVIEIGFRRFTYLKMKEMAYHLKYVNHNLEIASLAKSIYGLEQILRRNKVNSQRAGKGGIRKALNKINEVEGIIPSFSKAINNLTMGWSRGYPNALLARSSHGKSTFIFNEIQHKIKHNIVNKIALISPEEDDVTFWRRASAFEFNLNITALKAGLVKITDEQMAIVEKKYEGKVDFFHEDMVKYRNVIDLLFSLQDYELIIIDHVTAIEYAGSGNSLQNLAGGIIYLVHRETEFLSKNKQSTIINVNQVREKDIESSIKTYWKMPSYTMAYGNSVTYVASREWITLYYPYRDLVNRSYEWMGVTDLPTMNDLHFAVEKSSSGEIGSGVLQFIPEYARLSDKDIKIKKEVIINQEELFINESKKKR